MNLLLSFLQHGEVAARFLRSVCPAGLNLTQSLACFYLSQNADGKNETSDLTPIQLSRMLGCSEAKLVSQLLPLIERELISKSYGTIDNRNRLYRITPRGSRLAKEFQLGVEQLNNQVGLLLSVKQRKELGRFNEGFEAALQQGYLNSPAALNAALKNGVLKPNRRKYTYRVPDIVKSSD